MVSGTRAFLSVLSLYCALGLFYDLWVVNRIQKAVTMQETLEVLMLARKPIHRFLGFVFFPIRAIMIKIRIADLKKAEELEDLFDDEDEEYFED